MPDTPVPAPSSQPVTPANSAARERTYSASSSEPRHTCVTRPAVSSAGCSVVERMRPVLQHIAHGACVLSHVLQGTTERKTERPSGDSITTAMGATARLTCKPASRSGVAIRWLTARVSVGFAAVCGRLSKIRSPSASEPVSMSLTRCSLCRSRALTSFSLHSSEPLSSSAPCSVMRRRLAGRTSTSACSRRQLAWAQFQLNVRMAVCTSAVLDLTPHPMCTSLSTRLVSGSGCHCWAAPVSWTASISAAARDAVAWLPIALRLALLRGVPQAVQLHLCQGPCLLRAMHTASAESRHHKSTTGEGGLNWIQLYCCKRSNRILMQHDCCATAVCVNRFGACIFAKAHVVQLRFVGNATVLDHVGHLARAGLPCQDHR